MSEQEYIEHLERLDRGGCAHPLMCFLRQGYTAVTVAYMRRVLESVPKEVVVGNIALKMLYVRKSRLFGERAQASNAMCDLPEDAKHDAARADWSRKIQALQGEISDVMKEIAQHERGIYIAALAPDEVPADRAELIKKMLVLRASLSRARKEEKNKKPGADQKVLKYQKELSDVESRIKNI